MPNVLIAIERLDEAQSLAQAFVDNGHQVQTVRNGVEALTMTRSGRPDVILADVHMAELNGYQMCRYLKEETELREIPVFLLSEEDTEADRFWSAEMGATGFIAKPVRPADVVGRIEELLG